MKKLLNIFLMVLCLGFGSEAWANGVAKEELDHYVRVQEALAADSLGEAKAAAATLAKKAQFTGLKQPAQKIARAASLETARQEFKRLSSVIVDGLKKDPRAGYNVYTCPMAKAEWVQSKTEVANPYFGKSMASCGTPLN